MMIQARTHYFYILIYGIIALILADNFHPLSAQNTIARIEFNGNRHFSAGNLIKRGALKEGLAYDQQLVHSANRSILAAYREDGYLYARIDSVTITIYRDQEIILNWYIEEDKPFKLGKIDIQNEIFTAATILDHLDLKTGDVYREARIESELKQIGLFFARRGYPLASVQPLQVPPRRQGGYYSLDLPILVKPGKKITIDEFSIKGNSVTRSQVILRELEMQRGDTYDQDKIERIPQNLYRLGFFKNIQSPVVMIKDSATILLAVEVEEGNTTTFDGILGYIPAAAGQTGQ